MISLVRRVISQYVANNDAAAAASIAFYALFTMAPTLVFASAAASSILGHAAAQQYISGWLQDVLGPGQASVLLQHVSRTSFLRHGLVPTVVSGFVLLWGASTALAQLRATLDGILGYSARSVREHIRSTLAGRLLAAGMATGLGALLVVASVGSALFVHWDIIEALPGPWLRPLVTRAAQTSSWLMVGFVFTVILRYLPMRRPPWLAVLPGALVGTSMFELGKYYLGVYVASSVIASAYGPSSALVAMLLWVYYSVQTFLVGAEICRALMGPGAARTR